MLDISSARIGVNVSPEEVENLPVNGRNFANLMTLATGATSDGNGGWASVRFNGKSNQQNYLNYDGVDGTYVWDASPGYLNATGSQFRLQTSMESVAEFRVNSGLAPAESGLGVRRQHHRRQQERQQQPPRLGVRIQARRRVSTAPNKYDDREAGAVDSTSSADRSAGRWPRTGRSSSPATKGLRQTTGLNFTEAVPSDEARRRILAGEPVGSGAGQSAERTRAVAPLLDGFPGGTTATSNALVALASLQSTAEQQEDTLSFRLDHQFNNSHSMYFRYLYSKGDVDTPDRTVTPRRVRAKQSPKNFVGNYQSVFGMHGERDQGRRATCRRRAPSPSERSRTTTRSASRSRARSPRRRSTRAATPASRAAAC